VDIPDHDYAQRVWRGAAAESKYGKSFPCAAGGPLVLRSFWLKPFSLLDAMKATLGSWRLLFCQQVCLLHPLNQCLDIESYSGPMTRKRGDVMVFRYHNDPDNYHK